MDGQLTIMGPGPGEACVRLVTDKSIPLNLNLLPESSGHPDKSIRPEWERKIRTRKRRVIVRIIGYIDCTSHNIALINRSICFYGVIFLLVCVLSPCA